MGKIASCRPLIRVLKDRQERRRFGIDFRQGCIVAFICVQIGKAVMNAGMMEHLDNADFLGNA